MVLVREAGQDPTIYINSVSSGSANRTSRFYTGESITTDLTLGMTKYNTQINQDYFDGEISEFTIHNGEVKSPADVLTSYSSVFGSSNNLTIKEGGSVEFDLTAQLVDIDGSESLSLVLEGAQEGIVVTDGNHSHILETDHFSVDVSGWDVDHLTVQSPAGFSGEFVVDVKAISSEEDGTSAETLKQITFNVIANAAPETADASFILEEDGYHIFSAAEFAFTDTNTEDSLQSVKITQLPTQGRLTYEEILVTENQEIPADRIYNLRFTPAANASGEGYADIGFTVSDGEVESAEKTFSFDVTTVNDAPTAANKNITLVQNGIHQFTASQFGVWDKESGTENLEVTITGINGDGTLYKLSSENSEGRTTVALNGKDYYEVISGDTFSRAELGELAFRSGVKTGNTTDASIDFKVTDVEGLDSETYSINIDVTLIGDQEDNILTGTAEDDLISGGAGNDILTGGEGSNIFSWSSSDSGSAAEPAEDTITDFQVGQGGDTLDLSDILAGDIEPLEDYLALNFENGDTTLEVKSDVNSSATQKIKLEGVDLSSYAGASTDAEILNNLLNDGNLQVD
ncbi:Serralysin B [invertebrate metagenome]|uniref:Serralysin B n=1 Tax=invertebrate metagenome TaxID=1711999 RepID=A0A2H9T8D8_9ZZZZ